MEENDRDNRENSNDEDGAKTLLSIRLTYRGMLLTALALVCFAVIFGFFMKKEKEKVYSSPKPDIVLFGDSIFAYYTDERSVASTLAGITGKSVLDASFGGTCMAYRDRDGRLDDTADATCMAALCQAFTAEDFRYQINTYTSSVATQYFGSRIRQLSETDLGGADTVVIEQLVNDYHNGLPARTGSDKYDEYTYEGALRSVITELKKKYPSLRIIVAAPPMSWYPEMTVSLDENGEKVFSADYSVMTGAGAKNFGGGNISEYTTVQREVSEELGVEYMDLSDAYGEEFARLAKEGGPAENDIIFRYSVDGLHPNEEGAGLIAEYIAEHINTDDSANR